MHKSRSRGAKRQKSKSVTGEQEINSPQRKRQRQKSIAYDDNNGELQWNSTHGYL